MHCLALSGRDRGTRRSSAVLHAGPPGGTCCASVFCPRPTQGFKHKNLPPQDTRAAPVSCAAPGWIKQLPRHGADPLFLDGRAGGTRAAGERAGAIGSLDAVNGNVQLLPEGRQGSRVTVGRLPSLSLRFPPTLHDYS